MKKVSMLQVPSTLKALDDVLNWLEIFKPDIKFPRDWMECQLALTEAFTNAVIHAHQDLPDSTPIEIRICLQESQVDLSIWDRGKAFDLPAYLATLPQKVNTQLEGGRGLFLIKAVASKIDYVQDDQGRNGLIISKKLNPGP
ncbi:MAG: ATP-binding protein [Synechococcaceae cyanobacterium SM2_3_2]|nr:ATP-binding protein [Synechococcaceae cyanobacterium SM2_3_2]